MRLIVYGRFYDPKEQKRLSNTIDYRGRINREQVAAVLKDCIYLSLDVHPACPNTVAEALASGVPVLAFDTGSLKELVEPGGGVVVPYGADAWKLEPPSVDNLMVGLDQILDDYPNYVRQARAIAEERCDIARVTEAYLNVFQKACKRQ
jgi:glycosyltransferase involved in cell wall biosynthesis